MPEVPAEIPFDVEIRLPQPKETEGQVDSEKDRQPIYERKPFYPAVHSVMRMLRRHQNELPETKDQVQLNQDQVDAMLLDVIALADEYLVAPQNSTAEEQQRKRISEFGILQDKNGEDLADAFLKDLALDKQAVSEEEQTENPVDQDIENNIIGLLSHHQVRNEFTRVFSQETSLRKDAKISISELITLENAIDTARARYRQIQNEPRNIDQGSASLPTGVIDRNLGKYLEIIETLEQRIKTKEARLGYRETGLLESSRLLKTRHQMKEHGFALTESRQALFDRISELTSAGYKIFLGGPTGTGKTSLAVFAMRQILDDENKFEVVSWSPETTTRDLFGKPIIKSNAEGKIESTMQKGPYAHMLSGETRGIVNDEFTSGQTATQLSLKRIYQARPGEGINLPGFNGQVFTKENYLEISTGNLRSKQHQQREEMDPAIAREFVSIAVPFMDSEEAKRVLLSSFMHEAGFLPLSKRDVEMLDQLCRAAEFTQKSFEGKFSPEERQGDLYRQIEPSGAEIHLTKTFFDSGTLFRLVSGVSGRTFSEHLRVNLAREINENPHLEALVQEKEVFKKILKAYGFNIDAPEGEDFYRPISASSESDSEKPYILPSGMGFLSKAEKINVDEFGGETKNQPESALKAKADKEIADLMSSSEIPDSVKAALSGLEAPLSGEIMEQMELAKEILKEDFLGPEEIKAAFLDQVEISEVPAIPFSKEELERAKELGQMLILRVDKAKDGSDLTMEKINSLLEGKIRDEAKVLLSVDWYKEEDFYKKEKPEASWALVSKEVVPDSTSKNYLEQTETLVKYIKEVFKGKTLPTEYFEAINEFDVEKAGIARIVGSSTESEWKEAARKLEALKINQLTRQTPTEALYDVIVRFQQTGERLLKDKWTWTKRRNSGGSLVDVGYFASVGAFVDRDGPGSSNSLLGVAFSRSR